MPEDRQDHTPGAQHRNPPHGEPRHDGILCFICMGERRERAARDGGTIRYSDSAAPNIDWARVPSDSSIVRVAVADEAPAFSLSDDEEPGMPTEAQPVHPSSPSPPPEPLNEDDEAVLDFVFPDPHPQALPSTRMGIPNRIYRYAKTRDAMDEYLEKWKAAYFLEKPASLTIGMEVEMYIVDPRGRPMDNYRTVERIIDGLPEHIWRDYYAYQLEIRTKPYKTVSGLMKNYRDFLQQSQEAFYANGLYLLPVSYMHGWVPCGIHLHVRYKGKQFPFERAWSAYPFMLQIAAFFRNSPNGGFLGGRAMESRHIGLAPRGKREFLSGALKYRDWHFNRTRRRHSDHPRHRMKNVNTLECRFYDTVDDVRLEQMVRAHYALMSYIKPTEFGDTIDDDYLAEIGMTRQSVLVNHDPFNISLDLTPTEFSFLFRKAFGVDDLFQPINWDRMGSLHSDSQMQRDLQAVVAATVQRFGGSPSREIWLRDCGWSGPMPRRMYTVRGDGVRPQACNCDRCVGERRRQIEEYVRMGMVTIPGRRR